VARTRPPNPTPPQIRGILCPYCGNISADPRRCDRCSGYFDPLSRQATQNAMGPWYIRDLTAPFRPGCSYETLRDLIRRGKDHARVDHPLAPPHGSSGTLPGRTPTVAHLFGVCHNCFAAVSPQEFSCASCGAVFTPRPIASTWAWPRSISSLARHPRRSSRRLPPMPRGRQPTGRNAPHTSLSINLCQQIKLRWRNRHACPAPQSSDSRCSSSCSRVLWALVRGAWPIWWGKRLQCHRRSLSPLLPSRPRRHCLSRTMRPNSPAAPTGASSAAKPQPTEPSIP
jgi:hypothetical protein